MDSEDIGASEAKTRLSGLLEKVSRGHVDRITRRRTGFGADKGKISASRDFDAPLPEDLLRAFGVK